MSPQVAVIGEALIDIVDGPGGSVEHVGGSPANVAVGLARQGVAAQLLTRIGRDPRGERIAEHLAASGAGLAASSWSAQPTATARAVLATDGSARYEFDIDWTIPAPDVDAAAVQLVHSGSIALFLDPGADVALGALERAAGTDILVTVDPNIRPALAGDHATAIARFGRAVAASDLVKLSDEDAAWLYPGRGEIEVLTEIAAHGPKVVVMTRGKDGLVAYGPGGIVTEPAWQVHVTDTIGAGDACMASLIASLIEDPAVLTDERMLRRALHRAAVTAGITVSRAGANPPTRAEIDRIS